MSITGSYASWCLGWLKGVRFALRHELGGAVRMIAEGLLFAQTTAAEREVCPSCKIIFLPGGIIKFNISFDPERAVVADRDFRGHANSKCVLGLPPDLKMYNTNRSEHLQSPPILCRF